MDIHSLNKTSFIAQIIFSTEETTNDEGNVRKEWNEIAHDTCVSLHASPAHMCAFIEDKSEGWPARD